MFYDKITLLWRRRGGTGAVQSSNRDITPGFVSLSITFVPKRKKERKKAAVYQKKIQFPDHIIIHALQGICNETSLHETAPTGFPKTKTQQVAHKIIMATRAIFPRSFHFPTGWATSLICLDRWSVSGRLPTLARRGHLALGESRRRLRYSCCRSNEARNGEGETRRGKVVVDRVGCARRRGRLLRGLLRPARGA